MIFKVCGFMDRKGKKGDMVVIEEREFILSWKRFENHQLKFGTAKSNGFSTATRKRKLSIRLDFDFQIFWRYR